MEERRGPSFGGPPNGPEPGGSTTRLSRAVVVLAVVAGLAALAVRVGPDAVEGFARLTADRPEAPRRVAEAPAPPRPADPFADIPDDMRAALVAAEENGGQSFRFRPRAAPSAVCEAMADAGLANAGWLPAGGEWECASDLVPIAGAAVPVPDEGPGNGSGESAPRPSTLYFTARGPAEDRIGVVRLKLNLDDPSAAATGRQMLADTLGRLSRLLAWSPSAAVGEAVAGHRKLSVFDRGIAVEVHPESGEVERLNVVLILESPARPLPADRFGRRPSAGP